MSLARHGSRPVAGNFAGALETVSDDSKEPAPPFCTLHVQRMPVPDWKKHQECYVKSRICPEHFTEIPDIRSAASLCMQKWGHPAISRTEQFLKRNFSQHEAWWMYYFDWRMVIDLWSTLCLRMSEKTLFYSSVRSPSKNCCDSVCLNLHVVDQDSEELRSSN